MAKTQHFWKTLAGDIEKAVASLAQLIGLLTATHRDLLKVLPGIQHAAEAEEEDCPDDVMQAFLLKVRNIRLTACKVEMLFWVEGKETVLRIPILEKLAHG